MKIARYLYVGWVLSWFLGIFLLIFPGYVVCILVPKVRRYSYYLTKFWSWVVHGVAFAPARTEWAFTPDPKERYVFCANHTSYFDIPTLVLTLPSYFAFVGKREGLAGIPLFGFMYRNLHILIDRSSPRSRYETYKRCLRALLVERQHLAIFPEGGIYRRDMPALKPFKDGAFRIAIEARTPVVPVTICNNWLFLPELDFMKGRRVRDVVVFHEPIPTEGMSLDDVPELKRRTAEAIESALRERHAEAFARLGR